MRSASMRRVLGWLLIGLACLLGTLCLWTVVGPVIRSWQVERAIARFERSPSQTSADGLAGFLQSHAATTKQGSRILALLRRPAITTRPTYPAGLPVWIAAEQPFRLALRDTMDCREDIRTVEGGDRRGVSGRRQSDPKPLCLRGLQADQAKPGTHTVTVRGASSISIQRRSRLTTRGYWMNDVLRLLGFSTGQGAQPARQYECEFEIPVEVTVVPREKAENIELIASAKLDDSMEDAFEVGSFPVLVGSARMGSGRNLHYTPKAIQYHDLPVSIAFRLTLHLSDPWGQEFSLEDPKPLVIRAGTSGRRFLSCRPQEPGTYTGTVILRPDPNSAYQDPAIESIWDGTLELPISLTFTEKPSRPPVQAANNRATSRKQ